MVSCEISSGPSATDANKAVRHKEHFVFIYGFPCCGRGNRALVTSSGQSKAVRPPGRTAKRKFLFQLNLAGAAELIALNECTSETAMAVLEPNDEGPKAA